MLMTTAGWLFFGFLVVYYLGAALLAIFEADMPFTKV